MDNVIKIENVTRSFKIQQRDENFLRYLCHRTYKMVDAVKNISLSVERGEVVGFIGPNGAGKSTTIKMMTGIIAPSSGKITLLGKVPYKNRKENAFHIGVLFGQRSQLWWDLPVIDTYRLLKRIYRIPDNVYQENLKKYGEILGLNEFIKQPVRQLSLGQRMRADMCASLLHNPEILFLDEPTIGLDVVVKKQIRDMIRDINQKRKTTVILTTHDMKDIEEICQRIVMIDKGKIVIDKPVGEVKNMFRGNNEIHFVLKEAPGRIELSDAENAEIQSDGNIVVVYDPEKVSSAKIISEISRQYQVVDLSIKETEIDEIIRNLYLQSSATVFQQTKNDTERGK